MVIDTETKGGEKMSVCSHCPYNIDEDGVMCCEYPDRNACFYGDEDVLEELDLEEALNTDYTHPDF